MITESALELLLYVHLKYQWRSSAPKSGGGAHKLFPENKKKKPKQTKRVTAA